MENLEKKSQQTQSTPSSNGNSINLTPSDRIILRYSMSKEFRQEYREFDQNRRENETFLQYLQRRKAR